MEPVMSQTMPTAPAAPVTLEDPATRAFSRSMMISAVRCTLTYVVFPWILPLAGITAGMGPALALPIGGVAIASNAFTIRRFWVADHKWKTLATVICLTVITLLSVLFVEDLVDLFS